MFLTSFKILDQNKETIRKSFPTTYVMFGMWDVIWDVWDDSECK